jgi:hypothetical protein
MGMIAMWRSGPDMASQWLIILSKEKVNLRGYLLLNPLVL